jgi:cytochrome c peroxidase
MCATRQASPRRPGLRPGLAGLAALAVAAGLAGTACLGPGSGPGLGPGPVAGTGTDAGPGLGTVDAPRGTNDGPRGAADPSRGTAEAPRGAAAALGLTGDEVSAILAHGPWPLPFVPDPTNRVSGDPAAIALGRRLFDDPRLSLDGRRSCASCHRPELGFSDGLPRSPAADGTPLDRNAQGLLDARLQHWFGWDGASDSLWAFVVRPLADPRELGIGPERLAALVDGDPGLACLRRAAFGAAPARPDRVRVEVAKALAAYLETLDSPRTRFDVFRDALARGDTDAAADYPPPALRGLRLFVGEGRCNLCHLGPAFTNGEFHDIGRPFMAAPGRPDPGRHGGIRTVRADPHNRLGRWSDAPPAAPGRPDAAVRIRHLAGSHRNFGEFRVPGLRAAVMTAPYGHDGSMATLDDVVAHYSALPVERLHADGEALLRPLNLDAARRGDLVAFLESLSTPARAPAPLRSAANAPMSGAQECPP